MTREKAIANVLRDYSRARDKGTRASTVERILRMREENARPWLVALFNNPPAGEVELVDAVFRILRGES